MELITMFLCSSQIFKIHKKIIINLFHEILNKLFKK